LQDDAFGQRRWTANPRRGIVSGQLSALIGLASSRLSQVLMSVLWANRVQFDISAECAPDDRLREAIHCHLAYGKMDCCASLAMTVAPSGAPQIHIDSAQDRYKI